MKIGVFTPCAAEAQLAKQFGRGGAAALDAFASGLRAIGQSHFIAPVTSYRPCDVAVVFGIRKDAVPASFPRGEVMNQQRIRGGHTIVMELGYVSRDIYYAVGWDGLNGRADFRNHNMPNDRWKRLGIDLKPWTEPDAGGHIVVCGQIPWDASVQHSAHIKWCQDTCRELMETSGKAVVFRPHPLSKVDYRVTGAEISTAPLAEDLDGAWCCVTFNSNSAVEAVLAGVPTIAMDQGAMAWDVTSHGLGDDLVAPDREQWCADLAYTQWNLAELKAGDAAAHLLGLEDRVRATA